MTTCRTQHRARLLVAKPRNMGMEVAPAGSNDRDRAAGAICVVGSKVWAARCLSWKSAGMLLEDVAHDKVS